MPVQGCSTLRAAPRRRRPLRLFPPGGPAEPGRSRPAPPLHPASRHRCARPRVTGTAPAGGAPRATPGRGPGGCRGSNRVPGPAACARVTAAGPPAAPRAQRPILPAPRGELRGGGWGERDSSAPRASRPARAGPRVTPLPAPRAARRGRSAPRPGRAAPARALVPGPALRSLQLRARLGSCSRGSPGSCGNWDHVGSTLLPQPGTGQVRNPGVPAATARAPRRPR